VTTSVPVEVEVDATPSFINTLAVALVALEVPLKVKVPLLAEEPLCIGLTKSPVLGTNARFALASGFNVVGSDPDAVPNNG
jgi:hypothetical protein